MKSAASSESSVSATSKSSASSSPDLTESRNRETLDDYHAHPIQQTDKISKIWDAVLERILKECHIEKWNSVGVFRIGKHVNWRCNAPTVLVAVGNSSEADHDKDREAVIKILNRFDLPMVGVKVVRASTYQGLSIRPSFQHSMLTNKAPVGQSIAPCGFTLGSGSFGGYLELKKHGKWARYGLTCSHVAFPEEVAGKLQSLCHKGTGRRVLTLI